MILVRKGSDRDILLMEPALLKFHRYLLLLSHMRSYSTLLCHILGSHPQIAGYAETGTTYETAVDLIKLNCWAFQHENYRSDCEYVLDKVLYDRFPVSDEVLGNPRVTALFIIREPEAAITSIVRARIREHEQGIMDWGALGMDPAAGAVEGAEYYIERLGTLCSYGARIADLGNRGLFLTSEGFLGDTAASFRFLESQLGLCGPLREDYHVFTRTGVCGSGDTSPRIRSGRILRECARSDEAPIVIPAELLDRARRLHADCLRAFRASPAITGL